MRKEKNTDQNIKLNPSSLFSLACHVMPMPGRCPLFVIQFLYILGGQLASPHAPLALHQLYEVGNESNEVVISLKGHDLDGDNTSATITALPRSGELFQLSHVFDTHGYDPKAGLPITTIPTVVTGKGPRVVYRRRPTPPIGSERYNKRDSDEFDYTVNDGSNKESLPGTVTLVSETSRQLVSSDFRLSDEGWTTEGNADSNVVRHEASRRGEMSNYIYAMDDIINIHNDKNDHQLWRFVLPEKYTGWYGSIYGGTFEFTLSSLIGDYSGVNDHWVDDKHHPLNLVQIYCATCDVFQGVTIAFPLSKVQKFDGNTTNYSLSMLESSGWVKDPKNTLLEWTIPTRCTFIEVLSGITNVKILGDFTNWYESVGIDNVRWKSAPSKGRYLMPVCAQQTPNARICSC